MEGPETRLSINRLRDALQTSFEWVIRRDRQEGVNDLAGAWSELVASALDDVQLMAPPIVDHSEPFFPFIHTHRLRTTLFSVLRSGMLGGPALDLIFQVWMETEDSRAAFGVPLLIRRIPSAGRIPDDLWEDIAETAQRLTRATPSGRVILFGDRADFDWGTASYLRYTPFIVMNAQTIAGLRSAPHPVSGRRIEHFCDDLASGWIGDPALSGRETSPILDEVLTNFFVGRVLRIRIVLDDGAPASIA